MVPCIDGGRDKGRSLGVGTGDDDELSAHHVRLSPTSNKTVDVLLYGHHHLSGHVAAFLGSRCLIFNMNASGTGLDEHPGQLQGRCQASMASVGICNDRPEIVDLGNI